MATPDPRYWKMVNGQVELTDEGRKMITGLLQDEVRMSFSVPQPVVAPVSPPGIRQQLEAQAAMYGFDYAAFKRYFDKYLTGSVTGRMNITHPLYHQVRKDTVDKPKIPVSGMTGFSEQGTPEDWDLAIGEVYGYRWWKIAVPARFAGYLEAPEKTISPDHARLVGANNQLWEPGMIEAKCTSGKSGRAPSWTDLLVGQAEPFKHEPPEIREACGCGFWAYFDQHLPVTSHFPDLGSGKPYRTYGDMVEIPVFGVIKGSGRVIIGEKGFRCQFAEIVGLALPEIAATQLSWWTKEWQIAETQRNARRTTFYQAAMGGQGWYDNERPAMTQTEVASQAVVMGRIAFVEGLLSTVYPDAKLMCDDTALRAYFPPDKNYS